MQSEILEYLKKQKTKWFSSMEISQALSVRKQIVMDGLKRLRRFGLVKWENNGHSYIYQHNAGAYKEKQR